MKKSKFPFYKQLDMMDCGPTCLKMIAKYHGKVFPIDFLREKANITRNGVSFAGIADAGESIGFKTLGVNVPATTLFSQAPLPCIIHWRGRHFVVVYKVKNDTVFVADPGYGLIKYSKEEFIKGWINNKNADLNSEGQVLLLEPTPEFYEAESGKHYKKEGFKFLYPYFQPYKKIIFQLFLGLLIGSIFQLIFPFLTQSLVDYGINHQNVNFVYLVLIAQLTLFFGQITVQFIRSWLLLHLTSRMNISLISSFLIKLMRLPISFFDSKNIGDLMQRLQDHDRVRNFLSIQSLNMLFSIINIIVFSVVLAYYNLAILGIFAIGSSLYIVWTLIFLKKRAEIDYRRFDQASYNQSSVIQLLNGMQEIKLNGSERRRRWEWEEIQIKLFKISVKSLKVSNAQSIGGLSIEQIKNIVISSVAALSVIEGSMTLGMMLSVQYIIGQLNLPISNFISFIQTAQDARLSLDRLQEIHKKDDEEDKENNYVNELPSNKSLNIENLSFKYGGSTSPYVLENLNLIIPEGKVTAIVGSSGSGKTTLIKILLKFYSSIEGSVLIGDVNLKNFGSSAWRENIGCVMQDGYIFSDTIVRNITESDSDSIIDKKRLHEAIRIANIESFIRALPNGYNTKIGASGMGISGGEKQRILIARAVYKNPEYLFFDEATSALDANNEKVIINNLQKFFQGKTAVIIAHRLSTVKNADKIIVLNEGKITETGNHVELVKSKGLYFNLVKNQLELGE